MRWSEEKSLLEKYVTCSDYKYSHLNMQVHFESGSVDLMKVAKVKYI